MANSQSIPYFGRAWDISVFAKDGTQLLLSSDQFKEALRIKFSVEMYMLLAYWRGQVLIYNPSEATATQIWQGTPAFGSKPGGLLNSSGILQGKQSFVLGDVVTISAGYKSQISGSFNRTTNVLYYGKVLQPTWTRENVVDYKLGLRLTTGLPEDAFNSVSFAMAANATALETLTKICEQAKMPIPIDKIDAASRSKLNQTMYPRGQALHGRPYELIRQILKHHSLFAWVKPIDPVTGIGGLNVRSFGGTTPAPDHTYGPPDLGSTSTAATTKKIVIGVPEQTQDGILLRVLLDPAVKIGDVFQLVPGTIINPYPIQFGALPPAAPAVNGTYTVVGIRHYGDTRGHGQDWYTEIHGVVPDFFANFLSSRNG